MDNSDTRQRIRENYSKSGEAYDEIRETTPRGTMQSKRDIDMFKHMLPDDLSGRTVLEVGAGTGRFTLPMLECGARLIATDVNEAMLGVLRNKVNAAGKQDQCDLKIEDAFELSFDDAVFDWVISLHMIPRFLTLADQQAALKQLCRVLKPGGRLLFNYRNSRSIYHVAYKGHAATPGQIKQILDGCHMRIVEQRGKWLLNRKLLNKLPLPLGRLLVAADGSLERFWPKRAWDVFLIAEKSESA